jgi:hypothetical protein
MDDSTLTMEYRCIFLIFFAAYPLCASKDQKTALDFPLVSSRTPITRQAPSIIK